jgi:hypothetical protein
MKKDSRDILRDRIIDFCFPLNKGACGIKTIMESSLLTDLEKKYACLYLQERPILDFEIIRRTVDNSFGKTQDQAHFKIPVSP